MDIAKISASVVTTRKPVLGSIVIVEGGGPPRPGIVIEVKSPTALRIYVFNPHTLDGDLTYAKDSEEYIRSKSCRSWQWPDAEIETTYLPIEMPGVTNPHE